MPRIGVGYGGLSWKKVRAIVEAVFKDWAVRWWSMRSSCPAVPIPRDFIRREKQNHGFTERLASFLQCW